MGQRVNKTKETVFTSSKHRWGAHFTDVESDSQRLSNLFGDAVSEPPDMLFPAVPCRHLIYTWEEENENPRTSTLELKVQSIRQDRT